MSRQGKLVNVFVVGDKFKCFITNKNIISISHLQALIKNEIASPFDQYQINVGQGVCEMQMKKIYEYVQEMNIHKKFQIILPGHYQKSSKHLTHKHRNENIMISDPIRMEDDIYQCYLMLNDNCAEMSDHVTGHHIQGMVLIEAARQMVLAVTEKFLIEKNRKVKPNFVTNSIHVEFKNFLFPLQVEMLSELTHVKRSITNNLSCNFSISFIQNNQECVKLMCSSLVLDADYIEEKEVYLANQCIDSHLHNHNIR